MTPNAERLPAKDLSGPLELWVVPLHCQDTFRLLLFLDHYCINMSSLLSSNLQHPLYPFTSILLEREKKIEAPEENVPISPTPSSPNEPYLCVNALLFLLLLWVINWVHI